MNYLSQKLAILERKNEVLMGKSPNLAQLPLMISLLIVLNNKSFIDKKTCLNETCAGQHHLFVPNYWSETKMVLHKSDSPIGDICNCCDSKRNCAIYICKFCESKACFYCLTESSKKAFI